MCACHVCCLSHTHTHIHTRKHTHFPTRLRIIESCSLLFSSLFIFLPLDVLHLVLSPSLSSLSPPLFLPFPFPHSLYRSAQGACAACVSGQPLPLAHAFQDFIYLSVGCALSLSLSRSPSHRCAFRFGQCGGERRPSRSAQETMSKVQVAVRVRPMNKRGADRASVCVCV